VEKCETLVLMLAMLLRYGIKMCKKYRKEKVGGIKIQTLRIEINDIFGSFFLVLRDENEGKMETYVELR
jgi:hypothetical protein